MGRAACSTPGRTRTASRRSNSDGGLQILQWTAASPGTRFCLYVHHTDAEREWAYDRDSSLARLDKGLDEAQAQGWRVVDMKQDWTTIFPPEKNELRSLRVDSALDRTTLSWIRTALTFATFG